MLSCYRVIPIILVLLLILNANEVKLQNGDTYSGCEDGYLSAQYATVLLQEMTSDTLTNHFSDLDIYLSRWTWRKQYARAAFRFDLSGISDTVAKAELQLTLKSGLATGTGVCTLYTINSEWNSSECSWFNAKQDQLWNNQGGDFNRDDFITANAVMFPDEVEIYDITAMVNSIIKGDKPNNGFIIEPATSSDLSIQMQDHIFYSSEQDDVEKRPALVLYDQVGILKTNKGLKTNIKINQTGNYLNVSVPHSDFKISMFDLKGREVYRNISQESSLNINHEKFGKGLFIIKVWNKFFTEKVQMSLF